LTGSLRLLDGTPLVGAPVELQQRILAHKGETLEEPVLAQTTTGADGRWSLPVAISPNQAARTALRAVCTGGPNLPVAVSDPLQVPGSVSFSVPAAPQSGQAPAPSAPESPPPAP
jgi:hypothetical protein